MAYQYKNANGTVFGIVHAKASTMAYIGGTMITQAETEKELENHLDDFSHDDIKKTLAYATIK